MATIREVAAKAGVSRSTVSLVLNNSPLVKDETRTHVLEVIKEMNYVPNSNARSLSSRVMNSLGVIILSEHKTDTTYSYNYDTGLYSLNVLNGISEALADTDYSVAIEHFCVLDSNGELPKLIKNRRVDGAFIVGGLYNPDFVMRMQQSGIPFVTVSVGAENATTDSVYADPADGVVMSFDYLAETGHKKIAFVNCPDFYLSAARRIDGINEAEKKTGIPFDWDLLIYTKSNSGHGGYDAMKELWEKGARPDAVVTANGPIAMGALRFLHEMGVRIPEDMSLVAYEDNALCGYATPALTTINIRKEEMGKVAAGLLLERLSDPETPVKSCRVESKLVLRDSVKERK